jgi:hypothetical protein
MAHHTGIVEKREGSNIVVGGKQYYVPPEKHWLFEKYPPGISVTLSEVKGTVTTITPLKGDSPSPPPEVSQPVYVTKEIPRALRQIPGFKNNERIGWQALLNTAVKIVDPSWRDDPNKTVYENLRARMELVTATATDLHMFITENLNEEISGHREITS